MTNEGSINFTPSATKPHQIASSIPPSGTPNPSYSYDLNGSMISRPDVDGSGSDVAKTSITYDREGRVDTVTTADHHTVRSIYDSSGERSVRIVDEGLAGQVVSVFFGKWFTVSGNQLTREFYMEEKLIAESTVTAPTGITVARLSPDERIRLAREFGDALNRGLYPEVSLTGMAAVTVAASIVFLCLGLVLLPGRRRLGFIGYVHRGRVAVLLVFFVTTLTPLPFARRAEAGCSGSGCGGGGGPPPKYPTLFFHSDHLGSTLMLTCANQPTNANCANGAVYRYFRYDAYGQVKAYTGSGALAGRGAEGTERLYTGQRWDWAAQVYYFHARYYDPRTGIFLGIDPMRQGINPYTLVQISS